LRRCGSVQRGLPSGKHTKNYGKSALLIGKSTINVPFSIAMLNYQRVIQRGYRKIKKNPVKVV
jgi:hypothetical protein